MPHVKTVLISMVISAATVALVFRVKALRNAVTGLA